MISTEVLGLVPLALVDAVSVATLAVPIWFLLAAGRIRHCLVLLYMGVVYVAYTGLGAVLLHALPSTRRAFVQLSQVAAFDVAQFGVGSAVMLFAAWYGLLHRPEKSRPERLDRWRERAVGEHGRAVTVVGVALMAVAAEVPTMWPYLSALRQISALDQGAGADLAVLAGYAAVMTVPAVVVFAAAVLLRSRSRPALRAVDHWLQCNAQENTAWLLAVLGLFVVSSTEVFQRLMGSWGAA